MRIKLGEKRFALFEEWISRLECESQENILVRTEELDWLCGDGELAKNMAIALKQVNSISSEQGFCVGAITANLAGLWNGELLDECESYELVGSHLKEDWPQRYEQPYIATPAIKLKFWERIFGIKGSKK